MAWPWPGYKHGAGRISACKQNRADSMKSWEPLLALLSESSLVGLSALGGMEGRQLCSLLKTCWSNVWSRPSMYYVSMFWPSICLFFKTLWSSMKYYFTLYNNMDTS